MIRAAIDGATRRNGKPDCVAAGGVFIQHFSCDGILIASLTLSCVEQGSTNQRGELLALLKALEHIAATGQEAQIITDSEYLFNAMTKMWYDRWLHNGWKTASGEDVKNKDIWQEILQVLSSCNEVNFFHIKGHVIPFGKVTATKSLIKDPTGTELAVLAAKQFDLRSGTKKNMCDNALTLSEKNNGFRLTPAILKDFVVINTVADAVATMAVENADRNI